MKRPHFEIMYLVTLNKMEDFSNLCCLLWYLNLRTCCWVLEIQFIFFWLFRTLTWPPISSPATPYLLETNPCRIRWETWCRLCCNKCKIPLCKEWWQIQSLYRYVCKGQIISECPYEIIVYPKIATKKFPRFLSWKFTTSRLVQNRVYLLANRT